MKMKKKLWLLILSSVIGLSLYIYSIAEQDFVQRPEDMAGGDSSTFMPQRTERTPLAQGSTELKFSGPVWSEG